MTISSESALDVNKLAPFKFWGQPELRVAIEIELDTEVAKTWTAQFKLGPVPSGAGCNYAVAGVNFELYQNIGWIERFTKFGDRAPLLDYIKNGDLNTDEMREFFSALVLGEVSAHVGNPATFEKHKEDLRIARYVAVLIAYGGRPTKVYDLAGRRFRANQHHAYSSKQIKRIFDEHRDEAWIGVTAIKGLFVTMKEKGILGGDLAVFIRPYIMGATGITEEDIRSTSSKTSPPKKG